MKYIIILLIILCLLAISQWIRNRIVKKLLNDVYDAAYIKKDEELFTLLIDSPQAKMTMSESTRLIIKLNYYISKDDEKNVVKIVNKLSKIKIDKKNEVAFYSTAIGYYAEKERDDTFELLSSFESHYQDTKDPNIVMLLVDCKMVYDIYIKKDLSLKDTLEELIRNSSDKNIKSVYQFRLAKLYKESKEFDKSRDLLQQAYQNSSAKQAKLKIKCILNGEWELL